MPRVSVVISTYNDSLYIKQSLLSVMSQSFSDWEVIIINDGSTDGTDAIVRSLVLEEPRFHYYFYAHNRGVVPCVTEALGLTQGEFIARLGADDLWVDKDKLAKQVAFLDAHPDYGLVGTWANAIDQTGQVLYKMDPLTEDEAIRQKLLIRNRFVDTSVLYRKALAVLAGGYRTQDTHNEDYSLALRLARLAHVGNLPEVSAHYRINPNGVTQTKTRQRVAAAINLINEHKRNYPNFMRAWLQWHVQYILVLIGGVSVLNALKSIYYKAA